MLKIIFVTVGVAIIIRATYFALGKCKPSFSLKPSRADEPMLGASKLQSQLRNYELCLSYLVGINAVVFSFSFDLSGLISLLGLIGIAFYLVDCHSNHRGSPVPDFEKMGWFYLFFYAALYLLFLHGLSYPFR